MPQEGQYTGQGGKGVSGRPNPAVQYKKPPPEPTPDPQREQERLADATQLSAVRMRESFQSSVKRDSTVYNAPDTLTYTAGMMNDPVTTAQVEQYLGFVTEAVGGENASAFVTSELLSNPVMRENTIAALNQLRGVQYGRVPYALEATHTDAELANMVLTQGASAVKGMSEGDRTRLRGIADDLINSIQSLPETSAAADQIGRAVAMAKTGDISIALSQEQIDLLGTLKGEFGQLGGLRQTGETSDALKAIGIEQVQQRGNGVVVLNEDWAKAHPDEAYAYKLALEADHPDIDFVFGREGIPGWVLNKFGTAVDVITAPFGAGLQQLNEWGENLVVDDATRAKAGTSADAIQKALDDGKVPDDKVEEAVTAIAHLRDTATDSGGWQQFKDNMFRNANPRYIGMGFADQAALAADIQPGDPAYGLFYGSMAIISNIVADPTTYVTGGLAGLRHARLAPEFKVAEEALAHTDEIAAALRLENPALTAEQAQAAARRVPEIAASSTEISKSWIRNATARLLAQTPEEIMVTKPYMKATDILWGIRERMGQRRFASFLATEFADEGPGLGRFVPLARKGPGQLGGDTKVAAYLASATSKGDLRFSLVVSQMGPGAELPNVAGLETRLRDVTRALNDDIAKTTGAKLAVEPDVRGASFTGYDSPSRIAEEIPQDPEYLYHATPPENLEAIRTEGLTTGNQEQQVFLAGSREHARAMAYDPSRTMVLRTRREGLGAIQRGEEGFGPYEYTVGDPIQPSQLEYLGADLEWHSLEGVPQAGMGASAREPLIVEQAWLTQTLRGRDWTRPMRQVFNAKQLRKMERLTGKALSPENEVLHAATASAEAIPHRTLANPGPRLAAYIEAHPDVEVSSRNLMQRWHDLFRPTGFGELLVFPGTSGEAKALRGANLGVDDILRRIQAANPEMSLKEARDAARRIASEQNVLADATEVSHGHILNMGRTLGISDTRMQELLAPWTAGELGTSAKNYKWWTSTWETMVAESPKLRAADKEQLMTMWNSLVNERSASYIERASARGIRVTEPTWYHTEVNPETLVAKDFPVPAFSADQFQTWRSPSLDRMHDYLSHVRRSELEWAKTGGWGKRNLSKAHLAMAQIWNSATNIWKTGVLGTRITALPARIVSEEMLRMAALDYSSLVWHPVEWFQSTKLGSRLYPGTDLALMGESPTHALGAAVNAVADNPSVRLARVGRETISIHETAENLPAFFRSYSERIGRMYASPEAHLTTHFLDNSEAALAAIRKRDFADSFLGVVADTSHTPLEAVERQQETIRQMIGTGDGAEMIRVALAKGKVSVDGEIVNVGTVGFSNWLQKMYEDRTWVPGTTELPVSAGVYLPASRWHLSHEFRDAVFGVIYTKPDLALARSPLWRQIASREYRNLIRRGYAPDKALSLSRSYAARGTADTLFSIGAKTTGEYFLRNLMPFFPAYRELANTWLLRVPFRMGSGTWSLGALTLARRADVWIDFLKNTGLVTTDKDGKLTVPLPWLSGIFQHFTGSNIVTAPFESLAGLLPTPTGLLDRDEEGNLLPLHERIRQLLPSLGGTSSAGLAMLNKIPGIEGWLNTIEDYTTLYGADSSLGPLSVDRFLEAHNIYAPWMSGTTRHMHEAMRQSAVFDGIRIAMSKNPPPDWSSYDSDGDGYLSKDEAAKYWDENHDQVDEFVAAGERYATNLYMLKGIASGLLPFSLNVSDTGKEKTAALWTLLNAIPQNDPLRGAAIQAFLDENPTLGSYMVRKTVDIRPGVLDPHESIDQFFDWVAKGKIKFPSSYDYTVFAMGMNSYSVYQSHIDAAYENAAIPAKGATAKRNPVKVYVQGKYPGVQEAMVNAVKLWNDAAGVKVLDIVPDGTEGAVPIRLANEHNGWYGVGTPRASRFAPDEEAEVVGLDSAHNVDPGGMYVAGTTSALKDEMNLTLAHELGHVLGLYHPFPTSTAEKYRPATANRWDPKDPSTWRVAPVGIMGNEMHPNSPTFRGLGPSQGEIDYLRNLIGYQPGKAGRPIKAGEWMTNFSAKDEIAQEKAGWEHFLALSKDYDPTTGQTKSFSAMFDEYMKLKNIHEGQTNDLSLEQQRLLEFSGIMREYALKLAPGEASSDNFYALQQEAYTALGTPTTTIGKGVNWAFDDVFNPYYAGLNERYNSLDTLNDWEKDAVYMDIRHWSNKYGQDFKNPDHPEWGTFPSPEKYYFTQLDAGEQRRQITNWANLPGAWLTSFQRRQVGYSVPDKKLSAAVIKDLPTKGPFSKTRLQTYDNAADALVDYMAREDTKLAKWVEAHNTTFSSNEVKAKDAKLQQTYSDVADSLGLSKFWKEINQPDYQRIDDALGLSRDSQVWKKVKGDADLLIKAWEGADISLAGSTAEAKRVHIWMVNQVRNLRRQDATFDSIMLDLSYALGKDGNPLGPDELVVKLFFDVFDTSHAYYLDKEK